MKIENREFEVQVPKADGSGIAEKVKVMVPVCWDEEIQDWLMTPEAHEIIDNTKARLIGLLLPAQLKDLRARCKCTHKEMGELFQVGEKSWTRWESGNHRPSRSINLLIRALYDGEISINYLLKRAGKPPREVEAVDLTKHSWFSIYATTEMPYVIVTDRGPVQVQLQSGVGKSEFLNALMHQVSQHSASPWPALAISKPKRPMKLDAPHKRFDYENAKLA